MIKNSGNIVPCILIPADYGSVLMEQSPADGKGILSATPPELTNAAPLLLGKTPSALDSKATLFMPNAEGVLTITATNSNKNPMLKVFFMSRPISHTGCC